MTSYVELFEKNGYAVVEDVFNETEIQDMKREISKIVDAFDFETIPKSVFSTEEEDKVCLIYNSIRQDQYNNELWHNLRALKSYFYSNIENCHEKSWFATILTEMSLKTQKNLWLLIENKNLYYLRCEIKSQSWYESEPCRLKT